MALAEEEKDWEDEVHEPFLIAYFYCYGCFMPECPLDYNVYIHEAS